MQAVEDTGGAATWHEGEDGNGSACGVKSGLFAGVESLGRVVTAFGVDVRLNFRDEPGDAWFFKKDHGIDTTESSDDFSAIEFAIDGAAGALEGADGVVGVDSDDESVSERAGLLEVSDVTGMKEVETAVGEDEVLAFMLERFAQVADLFGGGGVKIRG